MKLEGAIEENILTLLCWDEKNAAGIGLQLGPELFSTRIYRRIAEVAFGHLKQFSAPPRAHLRDLMETQIRKGEEGRLLQTAIDNIERLAPDLQSDYVLTTVNRFIAVRKMTVALEKASDALLDGDLEKAQDAITGQDLGAAPTSPGIWLSDADHMLSFMDKKEEDFFSSGIQVLDDRGVRPARKTLWVFIAPPKKGKSWHLIEVGKMAMMGGKKVLHITLENSAEITAQRYVQSLFAMSKDQVQQIRTPMFTRSTSGHIKIDFDVRTPESLSSSTRAKLAKKLGGLKNKARFLIKEFPTSMLSIAQLHAYLDMLERVESFVPDMLIIDYPDLMAIDSANLRIDTGRLYKELRGVGVQRNMAVVAVSQGSKIAAQSRTVTATMVGEDYSKIATADTIITYSQTSEEKRVGLARILVDAARNAEDKYITLISQSYTTGQFCIDSVFMSHHMETEVDRVAGEEGDRE